MGGKMTKAFINILSNLSHSINILYIATNLIQVSLQRVMQRDFYTQMSSYHTAGWCSTCGYPLTRLDKSVHFRCGHAYHEECVIAKEPKVCVVCLADRSDQFAYYINTLNPNYPKVKKVKEVMSKFDQQQMEMT